MSTAAEINDTSGGLIGFFKCLVFTDHSKSNIIVFFPPSELSSCGIYRVSTRCNVCILRFASEANFKSFINPHFLEFRSLWLPSIIQCNLTRNHRLCFQWLMAVKLCWVLNILVCISEVFLNTMCTLRWYIWT